MKPLLIRSREKRRGRGQGARALLGRPGASSGIKPALRGPQREDGQLRAGRRRRPGRAQNRGLAAVGVRSRTLGRAAGESLPLTTLKTCRGRLYRAALGLDRRGLGRRVTLIASLGAAGAGQVGLGLHRLPRAGLAKLRRRLERAASSPCPFFGSLGCINREHPTASGSNEAQKRPLQR